MVYSDPGAYVEEVIAQGAVTIGSVPLAVTLIGVAAPNRVFSNEPVVRGQVSQTLVVASSTPHSAPLTLPSNQLLSTTSVTQDGNALPTSSFSYSDASTIVIAPQSYNVLSVYVVTYLAPSSEQDELQNENAVQIDRVGSFPSVTSFMLGVDYQLTSGDVDWSILVVASLLGTPTTPFNLATNHFLKFSLDGLAPITVDVQGAIPSATTITEVVGFINAALTSSLIYGAPYSTAATNSGGHLKLSGIVPGITGSVTLLQAATFSAHLEVFGIATLALPLTVVGTGMEPTLGSTYYVTYEVTRPATDFNQYFQWLTPAAAYAIVGFPNIGNPLANYVNICFAQGAPQVYGVIALSTSDTDMITGIGATEAFSGMTEIVPISTSLNVQIATFQSVTNMSSLFQKKRRRGWFGMARNTAIGNIDTPNTLLYLAGATLQVPGDSPGRGRFIVTAPSECSYNITLQTVGTVNLSLDGTALAAATAAVCTAFTSASTSLLLKTLAGFNTITNLSDPQRALLASGGVSVVSLPGGVPTLSDPVTTEVAGGGLQEFEEISVMIQKDKVAILVEQAVKANLVGVVPEDLADFISDIKEIVGNTIKGLIDSKDIGKYTNPDGTQRDINFQTDIQASQNITDKTQFNFRYWFVGRYPAKRFFGQFSIDNPFFAPAQGSTAT